MSKYGLNFKHDPIQQDHFIEALKETGKVKDAAKATGIAVNTAYMLMRSDEEFKARASNARLEFIHNMAEVMRNHAPRAVDALLRVIEDRSAPASAKVSAASKILDYGIELGETADLEEKIASLQRDIEAYEAEQDDD